MLSGHEYDVAIVGGSVAGAATAIHLTRAGYDVAVIERRTVASGKACGEGIFPLGVAELERLDVLPRIACASAKLEELRFIIGGRAASARLGGGGRSALGVRRAVLDGAMIEAAADAGATIVHGVARALRTDGGRATAIAMDGGDVRARVFVGADGLHSPMRGWAKIAARNGHSRFGMSAHVVLRAEPSPRVDVYFRDGYEVYVTPVGGRVANVAVLHSRGRRGDGGGTAADGFRSRVAGCSSALAEAEVIDGPVGAGPFPLICERAWRSNVVLAGDAAGFYDGITGEGISLALLSARACAGAIDSYFGGGSFAAFGAYDAQRRSLARNSTLLARLTLSIARYPAIARWSVRNLARRPETFTRLTAINAGELPLHAIRPRDLAALAIGL